MSNTDTDSARKTFTLVIPTYGVEAYLPDFLSGLDGITGGLADVELIFVIDGSPDNSEQIIREWVGRTGSDATVLVKENGGLSSARNAGLSLATGRWVSFSDPDDVLNPGYFAALRSFLADQATQVEHLALLSAHMVRFTQDTSQSTNDHTLAFKFDGGDRVVDLDRQPRYIHLQVASAFMDVDLIRSAGLAFDVRVRPVYEDARFMMDYLLRAPSRTVGIVASAIYHYRQRVDGSSLVQGALTKTENYTEVPRYGYLPPLEYARENLGRAPRWLQYYVLYDINWFFKWDRLSQSPTAAIAPEIRDQFMDLITQALGYIDEDTIFQYKVSNVLWEIRVVWYAMKTGRVPEDVTIHAPVLDAHSRLRQIRYYAATANPMERLEIDGLTAEPAFAKSRAVVYFGRTVLVERILWVDATSTIAFYPHGHTQPARIAAGNAWGPSYELLPNQIWGKRKPAQLEFGRIPGNAPDPHPTFGERVTALRGRLGRSITKRWVLFWTTGRRRARSKFKDAWVLIDRDTMAGDNAEALYRYLAAEHPEVNPWFVIDRESTDYRRLKASGFKLIPHKSLTHVIAMRLAKHLISSQIDAYIVKPYNKALYGPADYTYTFLQHGVTKDDLSHWLNVKQIDRLLAATPDEYQSFVGELTPYLVTEKEVRLTGFPRHDELYTLHQNAAPHDRTILIAPTWRHHLQTHSSESTNQRSLRDGFWESEYATQWFTLLRDPRLREVAAAADLRIVFAPHPNLDGLIPADALPEGVELFSYAKADVKSELARARVTISDYSSLAFDAAYVQSDVIHFQFDRARFFDGSHAYRQGYFDYEQDGFGPVVESVDDVIEAIHRAVADEGVDEYRRRIREAFPFRDTRNSERTYESILELERPHG